MVDKAVALLSAVDVFTADAADLQLNCPRTLQAISDLRDAVADEFDLDLPDRFRQRAKRSETEAKLARQLNYQKTSNVRPQRPS